jgi:opacity protein-like surface antigen
MPNTQRELVAARLILGLLCAPFAYATPVVEYFKNSSWHPIMTVTTGTVFNANAGQSKNIPAHDGIISFYNYAAKHSIQTQALFGGSLGIEFLLRPQWSLQTSLGYYQPSDLKAKGVVTQGVDLPSSDKYSYQYSIKGQQLLAEAKLLYDYRHYHPYLTVGMGVAWTTAKDYTINIQPPFTAMSNQFSNHTSTNFSYSVGFGLDRDITDHTRIGVGYRFSDLGQARTGNGIINVVSTTNTLSQAHLYLNELQAQITFLI